MPSKFQQIYNHMIGLISQEKEEKKGFITLEFDSATPLTCESTHLHRFDHVQATSEPKVLFVNNAWYK